MTSQSTRVRFQGPICHLQLHRPDARNAIDDAMVDECRDAIAECEKKAIVLVLEGLPEVFCLGADLKGAVEGGGLGRGPEPLYDLWTSLAEGSFVSVAHVRGKANAGGMGFVSACDIVLADETAEFSLSELLFGLLPACVAPFLIRKVGFQRAHYLTLMTKPVPVPQACGWGLVDAYAADSATLLRQHVMRLRHLAKPAVARHKRYMARLHRGIEESRALAVATNRDAFSDPSNVEKIARFVQTGQFPWEE